MTLPTLMSRLFSRTTTPWAVSNRALDEDHVSGQCAHPVCFTVVVNGQQNQMILKFINSGTGNYTIVNAAASYHDVGKDWALVSHAMRFLKAQARQHPISTSHLIILFIGQKHHCVEV